MVEPRGLPVLLYHRLVRDRRELALLPAEEQPYALSLDLFEEHLRALREQGYAAVRPGEDAGAERPMVISFDDDHPSHLELAAPALAERGWKGLFLLTTGGLAGSDGEARFRAAALAGQGHTVGSHTRTHRFLNLLDGAELHAELAGSREDLRAVLDHAPQDLSCPGGRYDAAVLAAAAAAGYRRVYSSDPGINAGPRAGSGMHPPQVLDRICARAGWTAARVLDAVQGAGLRRARASAAVKRALRGLVGERAYDGAQRSVATWLARRHAGGAA